LQLTLWEEVEEDFQDRQGGYGEYDPEEPRYLPAITPRKIRIDGMLSACPCILGCNTLPSICWTIR